MRLSIYSTQTLAWDANNLVWYLVGSANTTINDTVHYTCKAVHQPIGADLSIIWTDKASGLYPNLSGVKVKGQVLSVEASILGTPVASGYDYLMATFCPEPRGTRVRVTCKDKDDSDRLWYVDCVVSPAQTGSGYTVTWWNFYIQSDVWYSSLSNTETTVSVTSSPTNFNITVAKGNAEVYPVFTLTPTSAKGTGQTLQGFITVLNYTDLPGQMYKVDITNGGLNTAAYISGDTTVTNLVNSVAIGPTTLTIPIDTPGGGGLIITPGMCWNAATGEQIYYTSISGGNMNVYTDGAGATGRGWGGTIAQAMSNNDVLRRSRMMANCYDVQIMVGTGNGNLVQASRLIDTPNDAHTKIWISMNMAARAVGTLAAAINDGTGGSPSLSIVISAPTGSFLPTNGLLLVESERITYGLYRPSNATATTLGRGAKYSTAAAHAAGVAVKALNEMWLFCGDPTATQYAYTNQNWQGYPLFDPHASSNDLHVFTTFNASGSNGAEEFVPANSAGTAQTYTADQNINNNPSANPVTDMGVSVVNKGHYAHWQATWPFGYVLAAATNVDRYNLPANTAWLTDPDSAEKVAIAKSPAPNAWSATNKTYTPAQARYRLQFYIQNTSTANFVKRASCSIGGLTVTPSTATNKTTEGRPYVNLEALTAIEYPLDGFLQSLTTGDTVRLTYMMRVGYKLIFNTLTRAISYCDNNGAFLADASGALGDYNARSQWLRLLNHLALPANPNDYNSMRYTEANVTGLNIDTSYQYRNTANG